MGDDSEDDRLFLIRGFKKGGYNPVPPNCMMMFDAFHMHYRVTPRLSTCLCDPREDCPDKDIPHTPERMLHRTGIYRSGPEVSRLCSRAHRGRQQIRTVWIWTIAIQAVCSIMILSSDIGVKYQAYRF